MSTENKPRKPITDQYYWSQSENTYNRTLAQIASRALRPRFFTLEAKRLLSSLPADKQITVLDFGAGRGMAAVTFAELMSEGRQQTRVIAVGEDPDQQHHHRLRRLTRDTNAQTELWDYTITAAQSMETFFQQENVTKLDFGWASFSLLYLSSRQLYETLLAIVTRLQTGAHFLILNMGSQQGLENNFSNVGNREARDLTPDELKTSTRHQLLVKMMHLNNEQLAQLVTTEPAEFAELQAYLATQFYQLVSIAVSGSERLTAEMLVEAKEAAALELAVVQQQLPAEVDLEKIARLLEFPYLSVAVYKIIQQQYLKKQFMYRQKYISKLLEEQPLQLTPIFTSDGFPVHCLLTKQ